MQDTTNQAGAAAERPEFLKPLDVQRILRISPHTLYDLLNSGAIPGRKIGGVWRVRRADIEALFEGERKASQ